MLLLAHLRILIFLPLVETPVVRGVSSLTSVHINGTHTADFARVHPRLAVVRQRNKHSVEALGRFLNRIARKSQPTFVVLTGYAIEAHRFDDAADNCVCGQIPKGTYYTVRKRVGRTKYRLLFLDTGETNKSVDPKFITAQLRWVSDQITGHSRDAFILLMRAPFRRDSFSQGLAFVTAGSVCVPFDNRPPVYEWDRGGATGRPFRDADSNRVFGSKRLQLAAIPALRGPYPNQFHRQREPDSETDPPSGPKRPGRWRCADD